jgi:hypothetical protein
MPIAGPGKGASPEKSRLRSVVRTTIPDAHPPPHTQTRITGCSFYLNMARQRSKGFFCQSLPPENTIFSNGRAFVAESHVCCLGEGPS